MIKSILRGLCSHTTEYLEITETRYNGNSCVHKEVICGNCGTVLIRKDQFNDLESMMIDRSKTNE